MAGFRNRLSHDYLSLEKEVIVDILNNRLVNFYEFTDIIIKYCKL